jgi:phage major head subunit gpT-like protein
MQHKGKLVQDMILNGTTNLAFDLIAFFSDASGVRVNDNLLAGTISAGSPTIAQAEADLDTVRQAMMQFVDTKGEILGLVPDVIACHPKLERIFRTVLQSSTDPAPSTSVNTGAYNPFKDWFKGVIPIPGATDVNDFYAFCTSYAVKPIIFQSRQAQQPWLDSTKAKVNRKLVFGSDYRGNVGYSLPLLAVKVVSGVA